MADAIEVDTATALYEDDRVRFTVTGNGFDITFSMPPVAAARFGQWLKDEAASVSA